MVVWQYETAFQQFVSVKPMEHCFHEGPWHSNIFCHVRGNKNRYFEPRHDLFLESNKSVFYA